MYSRLRILFLVVTAVIIVAVCAWRVAMNQPQDYAQQLAAAKIELPAPRFEGLDAHNQMFRLEGWLGRHRILVVFFSAEATAAKDANLLAVRDAYAELARHDIKVVGVSTTLPQHNRAAMEQVGDFPFPLVSDVDLTIHRRWGRLSATTNEPLTGVFLIDRKGSVAAVAFQPRPIEDLSATLKELTR